MDRRKILTGIGTVGIAAVAGCSSSDDGSTESSGGDGSSGTEESSGDDGSSETEESSEDEGGTPDERIHQIGETFTVGEGDRAIEYTVNDITSANQLGNEFSSAEANGVFVIIILSLTNKSSESFTITSNNYTIIAGEDRNVYEAAGFEARTALDTDERFDVESLSFEQLNPELSTEGALIFDVPQGLPYAFSIEPAGFLDTSEPHYVQPTSE
jgi:hypothetical protein